MNAVGERADQSGTEALTAMGRSCAHRTDLSPAHALALEVLRRRSGRTCSERANAEPVSGRVNSGDGRHVVTVSAWSVVALKVRVEQERVRSSVRTDARLACWAGRAACAGVISERAGAPRSDGVPGSPGPGG